MDGSELMSELIYKSLLIICDARIPPVYSRYETPGGLQSFSKTLMNEQFKLAVPAWASVLEIAQQWKKNILDPMVLDVLLLQPGLQQLKRGQPSMQEPFLGKIIGAAGEKLAMGEVTHTLVERWVLQCKPWKKVPSEWEGQTQLPKNKTQVMASSSYKQERIAIMFRSLYNILRLLPAYQLFLLVKSSAELCNFSLAMGVPKACLSVRHDETMLSRAFAPVESRWGKMYISVSYRKLVNASMVESNLLILPYVISDYMRLPSSRELRSRFAADGTPVHIFQDKNLIQRAVTFPLESDRSSAMKRKKDPQLLKHPQGLQFKLQTDMHIPYACKAELRKSTTKACYLNLKDEEVTFPFAEDDVIGNDDRCQDAALGALIRALRCSSPLTQIQHGKNSGKSLNDALDELRCYKVISGNPKLSDT